MDEVCPKKKVAILDNCEIESLRLLEQDGIDVIRMLDCYDTIYITGWVWIEVCDSALRQGFVENLVKRGAAIRIIEEKDFVEINSKELVLAEKFMQVIRPWSKLNSYFHRVILCGNNVVDIDYFFQEWVEKVYEEWPDANKTITDCRGNKRVIKRNAW